MQYLVIILLVSLTFLNIESMPIVGIGVLDVDDKAFMEHENTEYENLSLSIEQDTPQLTDDYINLVDNDNDNDNDKITESSGSDNVQLTTKISNVKKSPTTTITTISPTEIYADAKLKFIIFMNNIKLVLTLVAFILLSTLYYYYYMTTHSWKPDINKLLKNIIILQFCYLGMIAIFCIF